MSLELKLENICQSTVEWLLSTQMQFFEKTAKFLKNNGAQITLIKGT